MSGRRKRGSHRGGLNSKYFGSGMKHVGSTTENIPGGVERLIFGELPPGPSIESTFDEFDACEIDKLSDADLSEIFMRLPPYVGSTKGRISDDVQRFGELPPGPSIESTFESACEIDKLSDADLSEIFKRLPPYMRLIVSEVCKRWHGVSRSPWTDVTHLDLSPIPGPNIAAVVKQCPNLRHVYAQRKTFGIRELHILSHLSLSSVKLYGCTVYVSSMYNGLADVFSVAFGTAVWEELVLHTLTVNLPPDPHCGFVRFKEGGEFPTYFPPSLKRLQLGGVTLQRFDGESSAGIERLRHLECLILHSTQLGVALPGELSSLRNLKELCISVTDVGHVWENALMSLPVLEVLFLCHFCVSSGSFGLLATKHPSLRLLVLLPGWFEPMDFPARVRYANGFHAPPLPQLHIFVDKKASENIRFPKYPSEAAKVYPISEPLPEFLDRAEIKPIVEGAWIVEKIKETTKHGTIFYRHDIAATLQSILHNSFEDHMAAILG